MICRWCNKKILDHTKQFTLIGPDENQKRIRVYFCRDACIYQYISDAVDKSLEKIGVRVLFGTGQTIKILNKVLLEKGE